MKQFSQSQQENDENSQQPKQTNIDISGGQFGVVGDHATIQGGVHFYSPAPQPPAIDPAEALARLAEMPTETIPDPAPLPTPHRMPLARNEHFVGREADLKRLARTLKGAGATAAIGQVAAATGLGGIGKSQLAAAFAHRYGHYFLGGVFWLSFAEPANVPTEVAACAPLDSDGLELAAQVRRVRAAWEEPLPRLLIFDNCEDEALLDEWRPKTGGSRVLVTSRRGQWSRSLGLTPLALGVLSRAESVALLVKFRPDLGPEAGPPSPPEGGTSSSPEGGTSSSPEGGPPNPPEGGTSAFSPPSGGSGGETGLEAIAAELGDLPLALHLAGSYLESYADDPALGDPAAFLAELRDSALLEHPALVGEDVSPSPTNHGLHVGRSFALSYDRLRAEAPVDGTARRLLARAACFLPGEPLPRDLLLATLGLDPDDRPARRQAAQGLRRLQSLGLLEAEADGSLRLHRLLARFIQDLRPDDTARSAVEAALLKEADQLNNAGYPAPLLEWQAHLRHVTDTTRREESEQAAGLCNTLGYHLDMVGEYEAARPYYERALAIRETVLGPEHPHTAQSLNNLGALLQATGDNAGARPTFERALAIREKVLGPEHPDTASSLNNLGALLQAMGDNAGARPYYERTLAIFEKILGPEHPHTATNLNNLGFLLQAMGEYEAARPYVERALAIREQVLGPEHPHTASSLNNLGFLLQAMGDYEGARPYYERALAIWETVLGPEHPDTASSLNNLGGLLQAMGEYEGARPYYERALAIWEKVLGPEHPDTANSLNNLAVLCFYQDKFEEAAAFMRRALAIRETKLGPDHPDTQRSRRNLAAIEERLGDSAG